MISVEELPRFPASMDEVLEERRETGHLLRKVVEKARARAGERGVGGTERERGTETGRPRRWSPQIPSPRQRESVTYRSR